MTNQKKQDPNDVLRQAIIDSPLPTAEMRLDYAACVLRDDQEGVSQHHAAADAGQRRRDVTQAASGPRKQAEDLASTADSLLHDPGSAPTAVGEAVIAAAQAELLADRTDQLLRRLLTRRPIAWEDEPHNELVTNVRRRDLRTAVELAEFRDDCLADPSLLDGLPVTRNDLDVATRTVQDARRYLSQLESGGFPGMPADEAARKAAEIRQVLKHPGDTVAMGDHDQYDTVHYIGPGRSA